MATFKRRKKTCYFTDNKVKKIDWKDADLLKRFVSDRGKILPRRVTGACAKHQRHIAEQIKTIIDNHNLYLTKLKPKKREQVIKNYATAQLREIIEDPINRR